MLGHPRRASLAGALAEAYRKGALRAGARVELLCLGDLEFEPDVTCVEISAQPLEADLRDAQRLIAWADHLVLVYPNWWGTMPARLKGFLDRVLTPGFAFARRPGGGFVPLLKGRTAELITTMDTPGWVYRWLFRAPGHNAMRHAVLGFCGIELAKVTSFGPVEESTPAERRAWLARARARGLALAGGPWSAAQRTRAKLGGYLRAARLQFYPMTWLAYTVGALAAAGSLGGFDAISFWLGLLCLFFIEVATVLTNEVFDYESDLQNVNFGPFTGGSRVLVEGRLSFAEAHMATAVAITLAALCGGALATGGPAAAPTVAVLLLIMAILALGYTVPPLRLSYRGLGELDVAFTHSIGVLLCGFAFQGAAWSSSLPWLLGLPLLLAVLPGIILAGIPDHDADRAVGKGTLAVRLGIRNAYLLAAIGAALAAATALALARVEATAGLLAGIGWFVLPHAAWLAILLVRRAHNEPRAVRIDGLMTVALSYTVWFGAIPLVNLL